MKDYLVLGSALLTGALLGQCISISLGIAESKPSAWLQPFIHVGWALIGAWLMRKRMKA